MIVSKLPLAVLFCEIMNMFIADEVIENTHF